MKISILLITSLMMLECRTNTDNLNNQKDTVKMSNSEIDTLVVIQEITNTLAHSEFRENIAFVVYNKDTANYCYVISQSIQTGRIRFKYVSNRYLQSFDKKDDSLEVSQTTDDSVAFNSKITEDSYIKELQLIIKSISRKIEMTDLKTIKLPISTIDKLPEYIEEEYKNYYRENIKYNSNTKISEIVQRSEITRKISQILTPYNMVIDKVSVDALINYNPENDSKNGKNIWDGLLIFNFKNIDN